MESVPRNSNLTPRNDTRMLRNAKRKLGKAVLKLESEARIPGRDLHASICLLPSLRPAPEATARGYGIAPQEFRRVQKTLQWTSSQASPPPTSSSEIGMSERLCMVSSKGITAAPGGRTPRS